MGGVFTVGFGAAYGTSKAGVAVMATSILRPDRMIQNTLPVLMAGIIAIYGLVAGIIITDNCTKTLLPCPSSSHFRDSPSLDRSSSFGSQ